MTTRINHCIMSNIIFIDVFRDHSLLRSEPTRLATENLMKYQTQNVRFSNFHCCFAIRTVRDFKIQSHSKKKKFIGLSYYGKF